MEKKTLYYDYVMFMLDIVVRNLGMVSLHYKFPVSTVVEAHPHI